MVVALLFVLGLVLLVIGAEALVRGASRLAASVGISPLVVGLTVVAFGTSAPELAVSVSSAFTGNADVAMGNVVGSNIFNVLLILGLAAVVTPLIVQQQLVRFDVPVMIGVSVLLLLLALDGRLGRLDGVLLFGGILAYTAWAIVASRRETKAVQEEYAQEFSDADRTAGSLAYDIGRVIAGLAMLVLGADWFVDGAVYAAEALGISSLVIGLTIVAAGTSMPELATSVVASIRGERDIAVGNVVGSNLFNILAVLGLSSLIGPSGVGVAEQALRVDIPIMIGVAVACLPVFFAGYVITRWNGLLFVGLYIAYLVYLYLNATGHAALGTFTAIMVWGVVPAVAVVLSVAVLRSVRRGHATA